MAIAALVPFVFMFARVNRKKLVIVIPARRTPVVFRMAGLAGCWKLSSLMIWIIGLIIIILVTAGTCIGGIVIVSLMAGGALICYAGMSSMKRIEIIVIWKGGRVPAGCGGMT